MKMANTTRYEMRTAYVRGFEASLKRLHCGNDERLIAIGHACINARFHGFSVIQPEALFESLEEIAEKTNGQLSSIIGAVSRQFYEIARKASVGVPNKNEVEALSDCIAHLREIKLVYTNMTLQESNTLKNSLTNDAKDAGSFRRTVRCLLSNRTTNHTEAQGPLYGVYRGMNQNGKSRRKSLPY